MATQQQHHSFPAAPLMALHVEAQPSRAAANPIHAQQQYERFHQLQQSSTARLPPVVDHLVVCACATVFVSFTPDCVAGVRVSGASQDAVESIAVRVHRDTGLEIYTKSNRSERLLVEVFLPTPTSLRSVEARDHATVVLESVLVDDPKADVRIHHVGECEIFVSSRQPLRMNSLALDPQGGGRIQLIAPALLVSTFVRANVPAVGEIRVFTGQLSAPVVTMETAGYGSVQLAALELDAFTKISASAVGQASVTTIGDRFRALQLKASAAGMGHVNILALQELTVHATECDAQGAGQVHVASHYAHGDVAHLSVAGSGVVDARDLVAREATVHAAGAATAVFRASEAAHVSIGGYGTATLVGVLPPRVTGRPSTEAAMPSLVEQLAGSRRPPVATPTRHDALEPRRETGWGELQLPTVVADFTAALKALWGGGHRDEQHEEPAPTPMP